LRRGQFHATPWALLVFGSLFSSVFGRDLGEAASGNVLGVVVSGVEAVEARLLRWIRWNGGVARKRASGSRQVEESKI
jgi:hypothetical protein